jgi:hypothetical protein
MGEVLNHAGAQWELLANLYAAAALAADDAHGEEHGLISQHYGISKTDLILVLDLAATAVEPGHAAPGQLHDNCSSCDAILAPRPSP